MNNFYKKTFVLPVSQVRLTTVGGLLCVADESTPVDMEPDYRALERGFSPMSMADLQDLLES